MKNVTQNKHPTLFFNYSILILFFLKMNYLVELVQQGNEEKNNSPDGKVPYETIRSLYQGYKELLFDESMSLERVFQEVFGLQNKPTPDVDGVVFQFQTAEQNTLEGSEAIVESVNQLALIHFFIFENLPPEVKEYQHGQPTDDLDVVFGDVAQVDQRSKYFIAYMKIALLYIRHALAQRNETGSKKITISDKEFICHFLEREKTNLRPHQEIIDIVQQHFIIHDLKILGDYVYEPKKAKPTFLKESDGELVCAVCKKKKSQHGFPPNHNANEWGDHVFRPWAKPMDDVNDVPMVFTGSYKRLEDFQGKRVKDLKGLIDAVLCQNDQGCYTATKDLLGAKKVADYFRDNTSYAQVEHLVTEPRMFSFQNGNLFTTKEDKVVFRPYVCQCFQEMCVCFEGKALPKGVAEKYFDIHYCQHQIFQHGDDDYSKIETPFLRKIFKDQGVEGNAFDWMAMLLFGRSFFEVKEKDTWEVFVHIVGPGGTGKSLICDLLKSCFKPKDIGILGNNAQGQFVLGDIYDKRFVLGSEMDSRLSLTRTDLCSMVTGEAMMITRKGLSAVPLDDGWKAPILLCGNTDIFSGSDDAGGSIRRRRVVVHFPNQTKAEDMDGDLINRLKMELPAILTKGIGMYLQMAKRHKNASFWKICPEFFVKSRKEADHRSNPILSFLRHITEITMELTYHNAAKISLNDLKLKYDAWADNTFSRTKVNGMETLKKETLDTVFKTHDIDCSTIMKETEDGSTLETVILGLGDRRTFGDHDDHGTEPLDQVEASANQIIQLMDGRGVDVLEVLDRVRSKLSNASQPTQPYTSSSAPDPYGMDTGYGYGV